MQTTKPSSLKILYAGTPDFAVPALDALLAYPQAEVIGVLTQPDRPSGRGKQLQISPVKACALVHHIDILQPESIRKNADFIQKIRVYKPDLIIVAAYGLILPPDLLTIPFHGCINIHASLLPAWRGAAPIQRAIMAGDKVTGISIMQMDQGLDTGDVLLKKTCAITPQDTTASLHDKLSNLGATAIIETLDKLIKQELSPVKQNSAYANYAAKLDKDEAAIDWSESAKNISRLIRALNPKPVAFTYLDKKRIKIWKASPLTAIDLVTSNNLTCGTNLPGTIVAITDRQLVVQCGEGLLSVETLQLPGKKAMPVASVMQGYKSLFQLDKQFTAES